MQRYEGSLEIINALLGCAIILPTCFDDPNTDAMFFEFNCDMQKKILDIYFHCVNWMRETVSSFATQREPMIRQKVLQRLAELINMEEKIRQLLLKAPSDYAPPQCQFITAQISYASNAKTGPKGRPAGSSTANKKGKKTAALTNDTDVTHLNDTNINDTTRAGDLTTKLAGANKLKSSVKNNFENLYGPKEIYRYVCSCKDITSK